MPTDNEYNYLADKAYAVDSKREKENARIPVKKGSILEVTDKDNKIINSYEVLKVKDNVENGMQAMAVAPIKNGKPDTSQVVIAFAGTNADDGLDILTDTQTVELNKNTLDISTKLNFNGYNK